MLHAMWLGSVFGPFLVIQGLWMLLCRANLMKVESSLKSSPCCFHMVGVIQLLVGLAIINTCCMGPIQGTSMLLAVLGWVFIVRAVVIFFVPKLMLKALASPKWNAVVAIIAFLWGIAICWMTFA